MGQTEIKNDLPFQFGLQHLLDRDGTPVAVAVVKATFVIEEDRLRLNEEQIPVMPAGQFWGEPGKSSYQYEPECSYYKPATDVVLIGAAVPDSPPATHVAFSFSVGPLRKRALAFGDRFWTPGFAGPFLSSPEPFESMPIIYERAFGGWDRSDPNPERHTFHPWNPVGKGFSRKSSSGQERVALPNIEDPSDLITDMNSMPKPVGFGFVNPDWQPRVSLAGTYDSSWAQSRMPLLPTDFDPRFFNSASEGLISEEFLIGNEEVILENCSSRPRLAFKLPGVPAPRCRFRLAGHASKIVTSNLDTVVINTLDNLVLLTWRCHLPVPRGPESLKELQFCRGQ